MRFAVFLLSVICLMCSCTDDQERIYGELVPVIFSPSLPGAVEIEASTRVVNNKWSGNEIVGIAPVAAGNNLVANTTIYQYKTSTSDSGSSSVTLTPSSTVLYYPVDNSNLNFYAYSPYKVPNTNTTQVTYSVSDQSDKTKMEATDFIWAKATGTHNKKNPNVNLQFGHKQSKIIIKVTAGVGVTQTDIGTDAAKLIINGMPNSGTYNLSTGNLVTLGSTGDITPYKSASTSTTITWEAIVPPHSSNGRTLKFTFNNKSYTYPILAEDSYESGKAFTYNLELTTSKVVFQSATITDWTGGSVAWSGEYVLRTSSDELIFSNLASSQTLQIQYQGTTTNPAAVVSSSPTDSRAGNAEWLTANLATTSTTSGQWTQRTLTVSTAANTSINMDGNSANAKRTGYIHIGLEGLRVVIEVTQGSAFEATDGLANCYMIAPGNAINVPVTRAIKYGGIPSGSASTCTWQVRKLWDDADVIDTYSISGTGGNGVLRVTAKSGKTGNAMIAITTSINSLQTICWSYHIWVTDYNPWQGNTYTNTGNRNNNGKHFVFMDRNLGATRTGTGAGLGSGLFYQWGRKDPFPAIGEQNTYLVSGNSDSGVFLIKSTDEGVLLSNTVWSPSTLIISTVAPFDWLRGHRVHDLWGHSGNKTIFDPCPKGWRVPKNSQGTSAGSPWYGFTIANAGNFNAGYPWGYGYPACGLRMGSAASVTYSNLGGYYWTASPVLAEGYAIGMGITPTTISIFDYSPRHQGLSIRCVRDE